MKQEELRQDSFQYELFDDGRLGRFAQDKSVTEGENGVCGTGILSPIQPLKQEAESDFLSPTLITYHLFCRMFADDAQ